jgi:DNA-binding NarL/FixJ family response regulator
VLLDEQPIWLNALGRIVARALVPVGSVTSPREALRLLDAERPELFVASIDIESAELDGLECVRHARARAPELLIIALSARENAFRRSAATAAGADVFVPKTVSEEQLLESVSDCLARGPEQRSSRAREPKGEAGGPPAASELTPRELEILHLVSRGYTNMEIAKQLWVTKWTVKFHLVNAYRKLGVSNRTQAARYVFDRGLTSMPVDRSAQAG